MGMRASESPIQRQKQLPMRRVSFAEASDAFWLVLFPDEPNREAAIQGWALEMLHHPDPNQGPALRKIERPNPDLADRISLMIDGRTLTLSVAVGSGETLTFLPASHAYAASDPLPTESESNSRSSTWPAASILSRSGLQLLGISRRSNQFNDNRALKVR
jgi:hypothetical protein